MAFGWNPVIGSAIDNLRIGPAGRTTGNNLLSQDDLFTNVEGWASIQVWISATSGISAGAVTFEISPDRRSWFPLPMAEVAAGAGSAASTVAITTSRTFAANINAAAFRVRASTNFEGGSVQVLATLSEEAIVLSGSGGGGGGGSTDVSGVEARLGATNEPAASTDTADRGLNGLFKRHLQRWTNLLDRIPTLGAKTVAGSIPVTPTLPTVTTATIIALQTSSIGANYATFSSAACSSLEIFNNTGTAIEYRRGGAGLTFPILNGTSRLIVGIANASEISFRRIDQSNTQVTINAEIFS